MGAGTPCPSAPSGPRTRESSSARVNPASIRGEPARRTFAHFQTGGGQITRLVLVLVLLVVAPASAQDREIEAGGGWYFVNPLGVHDFGEGSFPSANIAWTNWYSEQSGLAVGAMGLPAGVFGHVTWRHRWFYSESDDDDFTHLGVGAGPTLWVSHGRERPRINASFLWQLEVLTTRRIRDDLLLRAGFTFTPFLFIPVTMQPVVMVVWSR